MIFFCVPFTLLVAIYSLVVPPRKTDEKISGRVFLGGRKLTGPVIAARYCLTNLSTEQIVGMNWCFF